MPCFGSTLSWVLAEKIWKAQWLGVGITGTLIQSCLVWPRRLVLGLMTCAPIQGLPIASPSLERSRLRVVGLFFFYSNSGLQAKNNSMNKAEAAFFLTQLQKSHSISSTTFFWLQASPKPAQIQKRIQNSLLHRRKVKVTLQKSMQVGDTVAAIFGKCSLLSQHIILSQNNLF